MSLTHRWMSGWSEPSAPAISQQDEIVTWGELTLRIRRAAGWLRSQGVGPAAVVALQQPKCLAFLELHLAALAIGAITLPLNDRYTPAEVQWMLTDSGARLAVVPRFSLQAGSGGGRNGRRKRRHGYYSNI